VVQELTSDQWLVAELSSFQLKGTVKFCPQVAALLNVTPAHLDYHQTIEDYIDSKRKIFQNQTKQNRAVLNADDEICKQIGKNINSQICWFSRIKELEQGVYVKDGWIVVHLNGIKQTILPVSEVALLGEFNLENALAAIAMALACGCPIAAIQEILRSFTGVEHRMEYVETIQGVRYYNNSKATNAQAAIKSLQALEEPIVWIGGGLDRGVDFKELVPVLKQKVKAIVAYGQAKSILLDRAKDAGISKRYSAQEVKEAVQIASTLAQAGDVVLLSPACASWDLYTSFEERGSIFKQAVHSLQI
jgi:UDP-N-acetylmuramoylalanine--D-glutamate ligase